jgi:hypothetical protein
MARHPVKPRHRGSHSDLVRRLEPTGTAAVHAIIVPTIRRPARLRDAFDLGIKLDCPVLVLSSRWSCAKDVHVEANGRDVIAVDVRQDAIRAWPSFATTKLLEGYHRGRLTIDSDLSLKRNLGLAISRMMGWDNVLFLDDDIVGLDPGDIGAAAAGLARCDIVALRNVGYPDNSVVCHALRHVGRHVGVIQHSFVGGGAMMVAAQRSDSFFPKVYNEDWLFMLGYFTRRYGGYPLGITGTVQQDPYDPFLRTERARVEEFGDCLAEGIFALLDQKETLAAATLCYWTEFLKDRREMLARTLCAIPLLDLDPVCKQNMAACLRAAMGRNQFVTPELCMEYLATWQDDQAVWQRFLAGLTRSEDRREVLRRFGLDTNAYM